MAYYIITHYVILYVHRKFRQGEISGEPYSKSYWWQNNFVNMAVNEYTKYNFAIFGNIDEENLDE